MEKNWRCTLCNYVHKGDAPPDICPLCGVWAGVGENLFELITKGAEILHTSVSDLTGTDPQTTRRKAFYGISYGIYVITSQGAGRDNGQCVNSCFQITSEPPLIALGINKQTFTHELIEKSGKIGISVLSKNSHDLVRRFGYRTGRNYDKFDGLAVHRGKSGVLLLDDALSTLEAKVVNQFDAGTHTLFLAEVTAGEVLKRGEPMTYALFKATK